MAGGMLEPLAKKNIERFIEAWSGQPGSAGVEMATTAEHHAENLVGRFIGQSLPRKRTAAAAGRGAVCVGDVSPVGVLHAVFYRSPYAHARITRIDLSEVRRCPGVVLALSAADLADHVKHMSPFPFQSRDPFRSGNPTIKFTRSLWAGGRQGPVRRRGSGDDRGREPLRGGRRP